MLSRFRGPNVVRKQSGVISGSTPHHAGTTLWQHMLLQASVAAVLTVEVRVLLLECLPGKVVQGRAQTRVLGTVARASDRRAVVEVSL